MARVNRREVLADDEVQVVHCVSRCLRRGILCGDDPLTRMNYDHRRHWIRNRPEFLAGVSGDVCTELQLGKPGQSTDCLPVEAAKAGSGVTAVESNTAGQSGERKRVVEAPPRSESKGGFRRILIGLLMLLSSVCFWNALPESVSRNASDGVSAIAVAKTLAASEVHIETQPIELLTPGQRALARNPEISSAERRGYVEPDFHTWLLLSLELPKPDGSTLFIQMLRSKEWFSQQVRYIVAADQDANSQEPDDESLGFNDSHSYLTESVDEPLIPLSPLHPVYRDIAEVAETAQDAGAELIGLAVELDLPELGLTGDAIVTDIRTSPQIEPRVSNDDPRRVITATFHHTSGDVIDLVVTNGHGPNETFGTTINHPFWSVDRQ
ncbi:MAG: hypothetical protein RIK87_07695, partial [Fuerstiella sp.]